MKSISKLRALRYFCILAFQLFSIFPLAAILDLNNNGMSDLWEKQHNNGTLFGTSFVSTADPDQDGWDNGTEAVAGTDPFEPNPPDGIVVTQLESSQTQGAYTLSWPTIIGKRYRLQASYDLDTWFSVGNSHFATESSLSIGISAVQPDTTTPPKLFWRVIVGDVDDDNDLLTNAEEFQLGTLQNNADSDGDTLTDRAEILAGTNPLDNDTDEDGIPDHLDATPLVNNAIADPDGANLPADLNTYGSGGRLLGRYDFQNVIVGSTGGFPSSIPGQAHATATNIGWDVFSNPSGLPSFSAHFSSEVSYNRYLKLPHTIHHNSGAKHVCSYWVKLPKDAHKNNTSRIYSLLSIGYNQFAPSYLGTSSPLPALHWYCDMATKKIYVESYQVQIGTQFRFSGGWPIPEAWNDGNWHHIALKTDITKYNFYFDGQKQGNTITSNGIGLTLDTNSYTLIGRRDLTAATFSDVNYRFPEDSRLDRLRIYKTLSDAEILTLYNQDIDNDGLYDRTEARHRMWHDLNNDNTRNANESYYVCRPFHHDAIGTDHDKDGISSHDEQNIQAPTTNLYSDPANFDTDGDLLPDGWERAKGFSYANPDAISNKDQDSDGDGLSNYKEYLIGTEPKDSDTDDDGSNDGIENGGGSNPKDPTDQGQAPDPALTYSLKLGVGDQSGSDSEHYEMVIYTYDWETNSETEYTRVAPDSYGDYLEGNMAGFDPLQTYTFQIRWKGTKLDTYNGKGPDYDYTFKVEKVNSQDLVSVSEVFDPESASFEAGSILGQKQNVNDFVYSTEPKRVVAEGVVADLAMDYDMDGKIETLRIPMKTNANGLPTPLGPDETIQDKTLLESDSLRHCIVDINNNNTDLNGAGNSGADVDNSNNLLDTEADREEMQGGTVGHSFGKLRLWITPAAEFGVPWKKNSSGKYNLKLSLANPEQAEIIRVFDWKTYDKDKNKPEMLLGPGKTEHIIDASSFFDVETFRNGYHENKAKWFHNFCVEGITYGAATIKFEVIDVYDNNKVVLTKTARVGVNVDQYAQPQNKVPGEKEALELRGRNPHYIGLRELRVGDTDGFVRALKGRIICRVPSYQEKGASNAAKRAQLTTMRQNSLRVNGTANDAGQSFWIGVREDLGGGQMTWAQCGLRWQQDQLVKFADAPTAFIETGAFLAGRAPEAIKGQATPTSGDGITNAQVVNADPLQQWENEPLILDFIMWKKIISIQADGGDSTEANSWKVIFKDARAGKGAQWPQHYFVLSANAPTPQIQDSNVLNNYRNAYRKQKLNILDANLESSLSCAFAVGTSAAKGSIMGIAWANSMQNNISPSAQPADGDPVDLWNWLQAGFAWEGATVPTSKVKQIIRTGRNTNTQPDAEIGNKPHPFWKVTPMTDGFELWDLRNFGFGQQDEQ